MKKKKITKSMTAMLLLFVIAGACIGTSLAFITDKADVVQNTMIPGEVTTAVVEEFDVVNGVKSDVQIKNTGNTDAYIRAAVVVTWQDGQGNVYGQKPVEGTHYTMFVETGAQQNPDGKWIEGLDGFYYWSNPVAENAYTNILISSCTTKKTTGENPVDVRPEGLPSEYKLCVEIIASGIQAKGFADNGKAVVVEEWGVTLSNGTSGNITAGPAVNQ